jgi:hypothetical protein
MQMLEYHQHPDVARIAGRLVRHVTVVQTCWHHMYAHLPASIDGLPIVACILYMPQVDKWMQLQDRRGQRPQR